MKTPITLAVIAHVDHGKTTLVDAMLAQGGAFAAHEERAELVMDSGAQERERGITITSKNCAILRGDQKINIVDTPGHADFSSEVERVLKICDTVLLLVDAAEGPMPQTRFVTGKALALGLRPIVIVNKIDKPAADPVRTVNQVFDLFAELGATDEQLDFPVIYAIGRDGRAGTDEKNLAPDLAPLFEKIETTTTPRVGSPEDPLQILVYALEYDNFLGRIAVGRVVRGRVKNAAEIARIDRAGAVSRGKITKLFSFEGVRRVEIASADAGEIVRVAGFPAVTIGETLADPAAPEALPAIPIGEPTVAMSFSVNDSPLGGREGKFVTTRQIRDRLDRELETNVGLRVEPIAGTDSYLVSGRGELHLSVLLEAMRREGFELAVGRPTVIFHEENGQKTEPIEEAIVSVPETAVGGVIEELSRRRGEMKNMASEGGFARMVFEIPTRGLIGFRNEFVRMTRGEGTLDSRFARYDAVRGDIPARQTGSLISQETGKATLFALANLQERGVIFIEPGTEVYEGMIVGESSRPGDMTVAPTKGKQLTNMRTTSSDGITQLAPPSVPTLETAIEYLGDDELVEITPSSIRLRKKFLKEHERKKARNQG